MNNGLLKRIIENRIKRTISKHPVTVELEDELVRERVSAIVRGIESEIPESPEHPWNWEQK